jgi:hypothetical protein
MILYSSVAGSYVDVPNSYSYCGSGMFIPDPGSDFLPSRIPRSQIRIVPIPDPGSSKNLSILTQKKWFLSSRKYDPGCSFRIPDPDFLPIPNPGVKKAPDPGSGSATLAINKLFEWLFSRVPASHPWRPGFDSRFPVLGPLV